MPTNDTDATRQALAEAADRIRQSLERRSPDKAKGTWRVSNLTKSVKVYSHNVVARLTSTNGRHPLFGDRSHWYHENQRNPGRTGWADRAAEEAFDAAGADVLDTYVNVVASHSAYLRAQ